MPQILLSAKIGILPTSKDGRFLDANGACLYNYRTYDASPKKVDAPTFASWRRVDFVSFTRRLANE